MKERMIAMSRWLIRFEVGETLEDGAEPVQVNLRCLYPGAICMFGVGVGVGGRYPFSCFNKVSNYLYRLKEEGVTGLRFFFPFYTGLSTGQ